ATLLLLPLPPPPALPSFPTRRSSDLPSPAPSKAVTGEGASRPPVGKAPPRPLDAPRATSTAWRTHCDTRKPSRAAAASAAREGRSEEHTSELQSQSNLVCRLLLEKKN